MSKMYNTGNRSTGNWSTGNRSTGNWSTGNGSTGNWSTGYGSTGYCSTGNRSTGDRSTGDWSTGNRSTGNWSTGNWSTSSYSSGHFSTEDYSGFGAFNKPCSVEDWNSAIKPKFLYFDLTIWVASVNMTEEEKTAYPESETTRGYLKVVDYKEAFTKSYNEASEEDKALLLKLPNFDADVFLEISGVDVRVSTKEKETELKRISLIKKAEELLEEAKNL